jgi:alpha-beta hydrolase superfamily lysophospholipase
LAEGVASYTVETFQASDGYRWQYRCYAAADQAPRGQVICLHGIQSHAGWYEYSCTRLREAGFTVFFLDRRGSGVNIEDRGDTRSIGHLLGDLAEFLEMLTGKGGTERSALPRFLVGISWGGKLAAALEGIRPGLVQGLVLLCPGFFPRVRPSLRERLRIGWSRLVAPQRLFAIPLNDPELFTASPRWQDFLRQDPLSLHRATARFLVESRRLDRLLRSLPHRIHLPVLLLLAEKDRIIDNTATRRLVQKFASADKEIIEYPGAHHTLEFEPDPDRFIDDLIRWLNRHLEIV